MWEGFKLIEFVGTSEEFCFSSQKLETSNVLFEEPDVVRYDRSSLRWVYACKVSQAAFTHLCPDMKQCAGLNILYEMQYLLIFDVFPNFLQIPSKNKVFSLISDLTAFLLSLVSVSENEDSGFHCIEQLFDGLHDGLHWKTKVTPQSLGLVSVLIHFGLGQDLVLVNVVLTTTLMPIKLSKLI